MNEVYYYISWNGDTYSRHLGRSAIVFNFFNSHMITVRKSIIIRCMHVMCGSKIQVGVTSIYSNIFICLW
jgi:hypothetical protein